MQVHMLKLRAYSSSHTCCLNCILHSHLHLSLFNFGFEIIFLPSNVHLQSYEVSLTANFDSFILVFVLCTFNFTFSGLFATYSVPERSSKLLKLPLHISKLRISIKNRY